MTDTLWSDISEWNSVVDDQYPYQVLAVRSNDGTYRDHHFVQNYQWAKRALDSGKLRVLIIYLVYRQDWSNDLATLKSEVGMPHPNTVIMVDVESWGGQITGDQSASINLLYRGIVSWIGDPRRCIGYGNIYDLNSLWPTRPAGLRLIVAAYGSNPSYPGKLGHQFTDGQTTDHLFVPPFGYADVDSADGYDIDSFCAALGLSSQPTQGDTMAGIENIPIGPGSGVLPLGCPVGSGSQLMDTAWVSLFSKGPLGGAAKFWFQSDDAGISSVPVGDAAPEQIQFSNGHSSRLWAQVPDGTTMIRVEYDLPSGGVVTLETKPKQLSLAK